MDSVILVVYTCLLLLAGDICPNPGPRHQFTVATTNARSLNPNSQQGLAKLNELEHHLHKENISIIGITETWFSESIQDCDINIAGYSTMFRKDRNGQVGGGVAILVNDHIVCKRRPDLETTSSQWQDIWLETRTAGQKLLIACVYRPPSTSDIFFEEFERGIRKATTEKGQLIITGDFNCHHRDWGGCKNSLTTEPRRAEREYYSSIGKQIKTSDDCKLLWTVLNKATGKGRTGIPALSSQGSTLDKDKDKAELLNGIFVQTASGSNYPDHMKRLPQYTNKELTHIQLSVEEVYNVLQGLHVNKAPGPDGIPNRLLKEAAPVVSASLCELFNYSLATGKCLRNGNSQTSRPFIRREKRLTRTTTGLLPSCQQLYAFLTDNALLNPKQSGFRKGDGTVLQLLRIIDDWAKSIDDADVACTAAVFLDVRRAFDTVWHDGLIYKLSRYGIQGPLINWFSDYLSDRQQRVVINGEASSWGFPTAGVPQGSILGPLLFVLYLNDIKDLPCKSSINCFADDTSLYNSGRTAAEVASTTNADLNLVATWFQDWALQLHPDKCKVMCIRSPQSKVKLPPIYIADQLVEEVTTYTHLGVTMHYTLRWKEHAENVSSKSNKVLGLLSKLQRKLPREALETAYNTLVRTKLEYASVLFSNIGTTSCKTLEQVQYQAGRLVSGAMARTPRLKLLEELEWDSLAARRDYNRLLIMYKLVSGSVPPHLQVLIPTTRDSQRQLQVRLRNDAHLHVPFCRTATYRNSFVPYTTRLWNSLPSEVRESASYSQFRQRCRAHILSTRHHQKYRRLGDRQNNILTTRLRLDWSQLNSTLAKFKLTSRSCSCGATSETVAHFLLSCPLYEDARQILATEVRRLTDRPLSTNILLNGYPECGTDNIPTVSQDGSVGICDGYFRIQNAELTTSLPYLKTDPRIRRYLRRILSDPECGTDNIPTVSQDGSVGICDGYFRIQNAELTTSLPYLKTDPRIRRYLRRILSDPECGTDNIPTVSQDGSVGICDGYFRIQNAELTTSLPYLKTDPSVFVTDTFGSRMRN
ncbi:hypothetical protein Bbelb_290400 [Branchiostoma belcheri]|nr:hypothetical protein Bbelb_290400 [Branchiostoma belcheri]